ncbi:MAG: S-layer homology domain-containing protein [Clostridiales Family XIII bacterium]|nr:S-layer homology domain-containing protein [Clostridiales Family XIII bacterium]
MNFRSQFASSATQQLSIENNSSSSDRYDYARYDGAGQLTSTNDYASNTYLSLSVKPGGHTVVTAKNGAIDFWMPYQWHTDYFTITELSTPTLYYHTISGSSNSTQFASSATKQLSIENNSSSSDRYDYARYDSAGQLTSTSDYEINTISNSVSVKPGGKTVVTAKNGAIKFWMPYKWHTDHFTVTDLSIPALYYRLIKSTEATEFVSDAAQALTIETGASSSNKYNYERYDSTGKLLSSQTGATSFISVPAKGRVSAIAQSGDIFAHFPYAWLASLTITPAYDDVPDVDTGESEGVQREKSLVIASNRLDYKKDVFDFENEKADFFPRNWISNDKADGTGTNPYEITGDFKNMMFSEIEKDYKQKAKLKALTGEDKNAIVDIFNKEIQFPWTGSCFGMSAVLSLVKSGDLKSNGKLILNGTEYQGLSLAPMPRKDQYVFNLINYYYLLQHRDFMLNLRYGFIKHYISIEWVNGSEVPKWSLLPTEKMQENINRDIVDAVKAELGSGGVGNPMIIGMTFINAQGEKKVSHAVVAYDYNAETLDGMLYHVISIWDPNDKVNKKELVIYDNYEQFWFAGIDPYNGANPYPFYAIPVQAYNHTATPIKKIIMSKADAASSQATTFAAQSANIPEEKIFTLLTTNYRDFLIETSSGEYACVEGGVAVDGDLNMSPGFPLNEIGYDIELEFFLPELSPGETYSVTPTSGQRSIVTGEELAIYETSLYRSGADGFYARADAEAAGTLAFTAEGGVSAEFDEPTLMQIASTVNGFLDPLYTVTLSGTDTRLSLSPAETGMEIQSASDAPLRVEASGDYNSITFEDADASEGLVLSEADDEVLLSRTSDESVESAAIGHSVVFLSLGGTPIDALANITSGSAITAPTDPKREGYLFKGWYTEDTYVNKWDFSSPVVSDLILYARWEADPSDTSDSPKPTESTSGGSGGITPAPVTPAEKDETAAPAWTNPFADIKESDWFYDAVRYVSQKGLMNGVAADSFAPQATMTRAMFATVLSRHAGGAPGGGASFSDVPAGLWYTDGVLWAAENGIAAGVGDKRFKPNDPITREQLVVMLHNYAKHIELDTLVSGDLTAFADAAGVSAWAQEAVTWAVSAGLLNGKPGGLLDAGGTATRAEVAAILQRFIENPL